MLSSLESQARFLVIEGEKITPAQPPSLRLVLQAAGVSLLDKGDIARFETGSGEVILLRAVRIIIRPSGRKQRHLSRYLVGLSEAGVRWEIFLEVVKGLGNTLFRLRTSLQAGLLRLAAACLSPGLSVQKRAALTCA